MKNYVYFVQVDNLKGKPIRIGHTRREVEVRVAELRRQMPFYSLTILGQINADQEHESFLKRVFRDYMIIPTGHKNSSWFKSGSRLVDYINRTV